MKMTLKTSLLLVFLCFCSCGASGSHSTTNGHGTSTDPSATGSSASSNFTLPSESGDLRARADAFPTVGEGSEGYVSPNAAEQNTFRGALQNLLNGDEADADQAFKSIDLKATHFTDTSGANFILIRESQSPTRGWGMVAINLAGARKIILEAPHPSKDQYTENQAADLFLKLDAVALLVADSDRCADAAFSSCSGTTGVCNINGTAEAFRISDSAHFLSGIYQIAHEELMDHDASLTAVALHGFKQNVGEPFAYVSNGTDDLGDSNTLSNRFAAQLKALTGQNNAAQTCNDGAVGLTLCGTTDVQGRYANQSPNACTQSAPAASNRFLHLEQSLDLRTTGGTFHPDQVETVLGQMF